MARHNRIDEASSGYPRSWQTENETAWGGHDYPFSQVVGRVGDWLGRQKQRFTAAATVGTLVLTASAAFAVNDHFHRIQCTQEAQAPETFGPQALSVAQVAAIEKGTVSLGAVGLEGLEHDLGVPGTATITVTGLAPPGSRDAYSLDAAVVQHASVEGAGQLASKAAKGLREAAGHLDMTVDIKSDSGFYGPGVVSGPVTVFATVLPFCP